MAGPTVETINDNLNCVTLNDQKQKYQKELLVRVNTYMT